MLQTPQTQSFYVVQALATIREEWQQAVGNTSLLEVDSNLGMLLADVINHLNLPVDLQAAILGTELFQEMKDLLKSSSRN